MTSRMTDEGVPAGGQLTCESGGWITGRVPRPESAADAASLLELSAQSRPGNLRFVGDDRQVFMLGELRDADGLLTLAEAHERLFAPAPDQPREASQIEVACALDETGYEWSQPQPDRRQWLAVADDGHGCRCNLTATIIPSGIEVSGQPAAWQVEFAGSSESALVRFLVAAQGRIRFARFTWQAGKASAVSFAEMDRLDVELPDSVAAVVAACRLVCREVPALANATVAEAYLRAMI